MLDCRQCDVAKISDPTRIYDFLNGLPDRIGMTRIAPPYVFPYAGNDPTLVGITGMVLIAESHISIHSFTERSYAFLDCFSCKPFDPEPVVQWTIETFGVQAFDQHLQIRGVGF